MTKKNYDSDFCGSLPLNHINVIQDYGYMMLIDKKTFTIRQVSENIEEFAKLPAREMVGKQLQDFADTEPLLKLQSRFGEDFDKRVPLTLQIAGTKMMAMVHFKPEFIILELEETHKNEERSFGTAFEEIKYAIAAIEQADTVEKVSQVAISELRKVTGFNGIMMYHFDEQWNGTVIAEEKDHDGLEDYLGHTFPGSDVPRQARELYLKNPYRLIPDRQFQPVRLHPIMNPYTGGFTDLSDCNLRGVAAVHLEYLKNMNVRASMSIRVINNGQLWGLIACHHVTPLYLDLETCQICELLSSVISSRISAIIFKDDFESAAAIQQQQNTLIAQVYGSADLLSGLFYNDELNILEPFQAGGAAAMIGGKLHTIGAVPDHDFIENFVLWLQNKDIDQLYITSELPEVFDEAMQVYETASGVMVWPVNMKKGDYIMVFRPEIIKMINWGGDPNKAITFEPDSKNYHPRHSFKLWQETVRHTSMPWTAQERAAAETLKNFIFEYTTTQH